MTPYEQIGPLIKQLHDTLQKEANNRLNTEGLTMAQVHLLLKLKANPEGSYSLKELEKVLHVAQSTVVGIVKRSEQKNLVESYGDPKDKRIKKIRLTPKGLESCQLAIQHLDNVERQFLADLTPAEKAILIELLQKIINTAS